MINIKFLIAALIIVILAFVYYYMFSKNDTIPISISNIPATNTNIVPENPPDSHSIISLNDVENYSLVTDGNISLSFDDDDTYLVDS